MPNYHYQKGVRAERALKKRLETEGYYATRTPGSKSKVDVIAVKRCGLCLSCNGHGNSILCTFPIIKFYQVKTGKAKPDKAEKEAILSVEKKTGISIEIISM